MKPILNDNETPPLRMIELSGSGSFHFDGVEA
jgi:hypothetical protein